MYDVPLMVARGYASLSFLHSAAEYIGDLDVPAYIYHFGDFDPSGVNAGEKIEQTLREMAPDAEIHFERIAVTPDQIAQWDLPTRPTKTTDSRSKGFGDISVELDAIPPDRTAAARPVRYRAASAEAPIRDPEGRRSQRARNHHAAGQRHGRGGRAMRDADASPSTADRLRKARGKNGSGRVPTDLKPDDFYGYMIEHNTSSHRPARSGPPPASMPACPSIGKIKASTWLDQNRAVEQMTWAPGLPVDDQGPADRARRLVRAQGLPRLQPVPRRRW